ncbi:hypothetical protein FB45DRAFT_424905 [Roridomyces roridus]|uniref:Virilizer N-terminal domain-containing protein n=1 Tax=Roridomyces roridus TaxID=1738132 RepID=A0AAD7FUC5_9AGAR|nr:hypothetical protein FB45DRAFT_424905 [Roridomyces roridus]
MVLLHWATLLPESSIAAVRFTAPIRVHFIRVFPTGARPFEQHSPDIVACTEPDAFFLDVFFNAQPTTAESKEKQRATNALVPTSIAYAGGQVDFTVDMGTEYATRLMIVKGEFQSVSMAIYGEVISESTSEASVAYESTPLPHVEPIPLSSTIDPCNMLDPSHLAKRLLSLIPDSPPLALVIRLMFCLKPSNEDWDLPEFPYLHADIQVDKDLFFDLDTALSCTAKPVRDDVSYEVLSAFASKVAEAVGPKSSNQAYSVAKLLSIAAPQHPDMARTLLQQVDLTAVFDARTMDDEVTLLRLLDAVANADIARHLNTRWFLAELDELSASPTTEKHTNTAVMRLKTRISHWAAFEDALSNSAGDVHHSVRMLKDVGLEEFAMGTWLETMLNHPNLVAKLEENPITPTLPAQLLQSVLPTEIKHGDLIAFIRAYIGVASVLAVWAWTDSLGNDDCRAQTLAIVRLWQNVDGYREIVNHLLLLRQLTRRLEWITTDNIPPRKSGILAEQILADLTQEPDAILRADFVQTILSLNPPLSYIAEHERLLMRKIALVADEGIGAAIDDLKFNSQHPLSPRRLRTIRVSLAIVRRELDLDPEGEWRILEALWDENAHGFVDRLVEIFRGVADDLNAHFACTPNSSTATLVEQLFRTADDLLGLIDQLTPALLMTTRALRDLTCRIADVLACVDGALAGYPSHRGVAVAATDVRQIALGLLSKLSEPRVYAEPSKLGAEVVLRSLLEHATNPSGRDPASHFLQVSALVEHVLPETAADDIWVTSVLPSVLSELGAFFRLLEARKKVQFVERLVKVDDGVIGLGEWLLLEEVKHLAETLEALKHQLMSRELELVRQHQVFLSLQFLSELVSPAMADWCIEAIGSVPEISQVLAVCLRMLLDMHLESVVLEELTKVLDSRAETFEPSLKFVLGLSRLRTGKYELGGLLDVLKELPEEDEGYREMMRYEVGQTLAAIADKELSAEMAQIVLGVLGWLVEQGMDTLRGISASSLSQLYAKLEETAPSDSKLDSIKVSIRVDDDDAMVPAPTVLPDTLSLSVLDLENLLHPMVSPPSTPKGTSNTPDILGIVTSPTGLLRSPAATGLTKTYANNDFRVLRSSPTARLNTSRLPSMHVDVGIPGPLT